MSDITIGVVGPCGAGKSTLIAGLEPLGYHARHIAQEHSYVPYMWQRITNPDVLIYLDVSFEQATKRRQLDWTIAEYQEQQRRLSHAHQHADLIIETDRYTPQQVLALALEFLEKQ